MTTEDTKCTVGKTIFFQGENQTHPLFRIEPGISCQNAREQAKADLGRALPLRLGQSAAG